MKTVATSWLPRRKRCAGVYASAWLRRAMEQQHWQKDSDFNGVRGEAALAKLPEAERQEWQKLWEELEELRKRAGEAK